MVTNNTFTLGSGVSFLVQYGARNIVGFGNSKSWPTPLKVPVGDYLRVAPSYACVSWRVTDSMPNSREANS